MEAIEVEWSTGRKLMTSNGIHQHRTVLPRKLVWRDGMLDAELEEKFSIRPLMPVIENLRESGSVWTRQFPEFPDLRPVPDLLLYLLFSSPTPHFIVNFFDDTGGNWQRTVRHSLIGVETK
ncbi:hypothetical protein VTH82DRAFT_4907 [Thermothelomyces myriococcoides]